MLSSSRFWAPILCASSLLRLLCASSVPVMCLFCAPLHFYACYVPLLCTSTLPCLSSASSMHLYASVLLLCTSTLLCLFCATSVHLSKCGCQSGQRTISLKAVYNTDCLQHSLQHCLQHRSVPNTLYFKIDNVAPLSLSPIFFSGGIRTKIGRLSYYQSSE